MNTLTKSLVGIALIAASLPSQAITISLNPVTQTVTEGSSFEVALDISGLGSFTAPSISTFDLDINFDSSILGFSNAVFGDPILGDQLDLFGFGSLAFTTPSVGSVNLFELSFDLFSDLDALQADSFTLATLTFDAILPGISSLDISLNALGDSFGDPLSAELIGASVNVNGTGGSVPEPPTWLLLVLGGLISLYFVNRQGIKTISIA